MNKRIIHNGQGNIPDFSDGVKAVFHYRAQYYEKDKPEPIVIDDSREQWPRGYAKAVELIFGKKFKIPAWESCLKTMRINEVAEFLLSPAEVAEFPFISNFLRDLAKKEMPGTDVNAEDCCRSRCMGFFARGGGFHYPFLNDLFQKPRPLIFIFQLLKVFRPNEYEKDSWSLDMNEKLNSISTLKNEGNELYREGRLSEAIHRYAVALDRLESLVLLERPGEELYETVSQQKVPLLLNLSQCYLRQNSFYEALKTVEQVLEIDPRNQKALFRHGKALAGTWNLEEAKQDFRKLLSLNASLGSAISTEMQNVKKLEEEAKKSSRKTFGNLFSK